MKWEFVFSEFNWNLGQFKFSPTVVACNMQEGRALPSFFTFFVVATLSSCSIMYEYPMKYASLKCLSSVLFEY